MIWESGYWKDGLLKSAAKLEKYKQQKRWPESSYAILEKTTMLGFYSIRKLHEAGKLSKTTMDQKLSLCTYPCLSNNVTKFNCHRLDELYDLQTNDTESFDVLFLCHQFVHSYVFAPSFNNNRNLSGILLASDKQRHTALLKISIDQIIALFKEVGNDYPNSASYVWNDTRKDFDLTNAEAIKKRLRVD